MIAVRRLALAAVPLLPGCIASNVVAPADRMVATPLDSLAWTPAGAAVLDGLWASVDIRGDAAVSLRRIWYVFQPDGRYTAAALAEVDGVPTFQTLVGTWVCSAAGLALDGQAPVACEVAGEHLRFSAPGGAVVLRRDGQP